MELLIKICEICQKEFETLPNGTTRKYCFECSPTYPKGGSKAKTISALRVAMKKQAVKLKGGKCEVCGYNKCIQALEFHHLDPTKKDFTISNDHFKLIDAVKESQKCILLCSNCHKELHAGLWNLKEREEVKL